MPPRQQVQRHFGTVLLTTEVEFVSSEYPNEMKTAESSTSSPDGSDHGNVQSKWDESTTLHIHEPLIEIGDTDVYDSEFVSQNVYASSPAENRSTGPEDYLASGRLDMENLLYAAEQLERNIPLIGSALRGSNTSPIHQFSVDEINLLDRQMQQTRTSNFGATYFHSDPQIRGTTLDLTFHYDASRRHNWSSPTLAPPLYQSYNQGQMLTHTPDSQQLMADFYGGITTELQWRHDQHSSSIENPPNYAISSQLLLSNRSDSAFSHHGVNSQNAHQIPEVKSSVLPKRQSQQKSSVTYAKRKSHKKEVANRATTTNNREDLLPYVQTLLSERTNDGANNAIPERPLLPLSPYNYYYRDERDNIINGMQTDNDPLPAPVRDFSDDKLRQLLYQHWFDDPCKPKRTHRKSHGKMDFESLSKEIASRWHDLPREGRDFYRRVAKIDEAYYHEKIKEQKPSSVVLAPTNNSGSDEEKQSC